MNELISNNLMLVLNSVLLGLFFSVFLFGCYRSITAEGKNKSFLIKFFGIVTVIAAIECALQNYQVIVLALDHSIFHPIIISLNIYAMAFEAGAMFILSDYWGQTSQILTLKSTEQQIKEQKHWARFTLLSAWIVGFSAYIAYAFAFSQFKQGNWQFEILVLGCQGLGVALALWANVMQIIKGYQISSALSRYVVWMRRLSIHKVQFCFLYWMSSLINLLRSMFLISFTLILQFLEEEQNERWLFIYVYSFSNIPILLIFLMGFSTTSDPPQLETVLLEEVRSKSNSNSSQSKKQTQLSGSHEEKRIED